MKVLKICLLSILLIIIRGDVSAQQYTNSANYQKDKKKGIDLSAYQSDVNQASSTIQRGDVSRADASCNCYIDPDMTYILDAGLSNTDDGSSLLVNLPFTFCFYGTNYNSVYINANGNVSFGGSYPNFTATGFPDNSFVMVAPFWADVDTRGFGQVFYKVTPNAIYVNWVNVGYYDSHTDKRNTFQLVLTDGTDLSIGAGNNVAFCYKDMQWTTGDASNGTNGFSGDPATVGANKGDGTSFIQFGRFDKPGSFYDGPGLSTDGVDWLDDKSLKFNTCVAANNIPPIPLSVDNCDTITVCVGEQFTVDFVAPESGQVITVTADNSQAPNFSVVNTTSGLIGGITGVFSGTFGNVGINTLSFTATDNGTPVEATTIDVVFNVLGAEVDFSAVPENFRSYPNDNNNFIDQSQVSIIDTIDTWFWSFGDGITSGLEDPYHLYLDSGYYPVTLTINTRQGCTVSKTKYFTILPTLFPPNVMTPNNDKNNDIFSIIGLHFYNEVVLEVYNRWGVLVFEDNNYQGKWDGKNKTGVDLAEGVYYYVIKDDELKEDLKGTINIFR
jgi:gliding motility-associated-like protein